MLNKNNDASNKSEALIGAIIGKMSGMNKARKKFMLTIFIMYMGLRGRYNFLNMARYGEYSEQTYRNQFEKAFDFATFNYHLYQNSLSNHCINAFDPSFIPKSGKQTDHVGMFWSGCSQKALSGIEIGGFAIIDVDNNTGFPLEAIQTPSTKELKAEGKTLINYYALLVLERAELLQSVSKYLAVDGYFARKDFVNPITQQTDIEIISKLRQDANLYYIYTGKPTGLRGRPKTVDGKINMTAPDKRRIRLCFEEDSIKIYEGVVYSKTLRTKIKLSYIEIWDGGKYTGRYLVLFSTDLNLNGQQIYLYYKSRYQIEFLFRDAKQFTGLTHCQARDEKKLHFHFNTSLTSVGIAKVAYFFKNRKSLDMPFSMSDVKTMHLNKIMADRIFNNLKIDLTCRKNRKVYLQALWLGKIAS